MVSRPTAFVVNAGEGDPIDGPVAGNALIKARTETTGGSFALLEIEVGPSHGPPLHHHLREDEMWFILDGHFRFVADGRALDAPAGSFVFVPKDRIALLSESRGQLSASSGDVHSIGHGTVL